MGVPRQGCPSEATEVKLSRLVEVGVTTRFAALAGLLAVLVVALPTPVAWVLILGGDAALVLVAVLDYRRAPGPAVVAAERRCQDRLSLAVPNDVRVRLANTSGLATRLELRDTPPAGFEAVGVRTVLRLPAGCQVEHRYSVRPTSRGVFQFGDLWLRSTGPLGLARRAFAVPASHEVRVYPNIKAVGEYELLARRGALFEMGIRAARFRGGGTEFESLREYQSGDDFRLVDWKATARLRRPITQLLETERSQTLLLALDAGRLMAPRIDGVSKLDWAVNAALMMAYVGSVTDDFVGLLVFGRQVKTYLPPRKGRSQFLAILDALYRVEGELAAEPDYARALRFAATKTTKRSLFVVFSDLAGVEPSRRLRGVLAGLPPKHLPLLVTMRDEQVEAVLRRMPARVEDAYEQAVAQQLLLDRDQAKRALSERGAMVLDVLPRDLSVAAVNTYLDVKAKGKL